MNHLQFSLRSDTPERHESLLEGLGINHKIKYDASAVPCQGKYIFQIAAKNNLEKLAALGVLK